MLLEAYAHSPARWIPAPERGLANGWIFAGVGAGRHSRDRVYRRLVHRARENV